MIHTTSRKTKISVTDGHSVVFFITNQFTTCLKLKLVHSEFDLMFFSKQCAHLPWEMYILTPDLHRARGNLLLAKCSFEYFLDIKLLIFTATLPLKI